MIGHHIKIGTLLCVLALACCQKPFLEEYKPFVDAVCACETQACVANERDKASRNKRFLEEGAADPSLLYAKYGEAYKTLDEKLHTCGNRFTPETRVTPSALTTPNGTNDCLTRDKCALPCPDGGKQIETPTETHCKKDGKLHGLRLRWYATGRRKQSQLFRHETPQYGFTISWYENGQKSHEQSAKGTRDWYETGEQKAEFIGGKLYPKTQDGVMTKWFKNGNKKTVQHWKNGQPHGEFLFFYENGQKSIQSEYMEGKYNGVFTSWYENRQMNSKGNYSNDKLDGTVTVWHANGQKKSEAQYKEGQRLSQTCWDDKGTKIDCPKP